MEHAQCTYYVGNGWTQRPCSRPATDGLYCTQHRNVLTGQLSAVEMEARHAAARRQARMDTINALYSAAKHIRERDGILSVSRESLELLVVQMLTALAQACEDRTAEEWPDAVVALIMGQAQEYGIDLSDITLS